VREAIAEQQVIFEHRDGTRRAGLIRIEKPYAVDDGECCCAVIIDGLYERMPVVSGSSTLEALLYAVSLCASMLKGFVESGGRILRLDDDGDLGSDEIFDVEACFRPLAVATAAPNSHRRERKLRRGA